MRRFSRSPLRKGGALSPEAITLPASWQVRHGWRMPDMLVVLLCVLARARNPRPHQAASDEGRTTRGGTMTTGRRKRAPRRPPFGAWQVISGAVGLAAAAIAIGVLVVTDLNGAHPVRTVHSELPGIDLSGLDPAQVQTVLAASKREGCPCGCGFTLAECRFKDPTCPRSGPILDEMVGRLRQLGGDASKRNEEAE